MNCDHPSQWKGLPAPCIIDTGTVISKQDMQRLLTGLHRVKYTHLQNGVPISEGEGCVIEVFADPQRATLVANHALYLNVNSFDYLELGRSADGSWFDLIHEGRQLRLIPLSNPLEEQRHQSLDTAALEAMVAEVISASWDAQIDDEEFFPF